MWNAVGIHCHCKEWRALPWLGGAGSGSISGLCSCHCPCGMGTPLQSPAAKRSASGGLQPGEKLVNTAWWFEASRKRVEQWCINRGASEDWEGAERAGFGGTSSMLAWPYCAGRIKRGGQREPGTGCGPRNVAPAGTRRPQWPVRGAQPPQELEGLNGRPKEHGSSGNSQPQWLA